MKATAADRVLCLFLEICEANVKKGIITTASFPFSTFHTPCLFPLSSRSQSLSRTRTDRYSLRKIYQIHHNGLNHFSTDEYLTDAVFLVGVCVSVRVCVYVCASAPSHMAYVWRSEDTFARLVCSFNLYVGSGVRT